MAQSMRQEVKNLAEEVFEELIRECNEDIQTISASWNAPFPLIENMFAEILGKLLIAYSRK